MQELPACQAADLAVPAPGPAFPAQPAEAASSTGPSTFALGLGQLLAGCGVPSLAI